MCVLTGGHRRTVPTMKVAVLTSLTAALTYAQLASALTSLSDWNDGIATFYGGQPDGAWNRQPIMQTENDLLLIGRMHHHRVISPFVVV